MASFRKMIKYPGKNQNTQVKDKHNPFQKEWNSRKITNKNWTKKHPMIELHYKVKGTQSIFYQWLAVLLVACVDCEHLYIWFLGFALVYIQAFAKCHKTFKFVVRVQPWNLRNTPILESELWWWIHSSI